MSKKENSNNNVGRRSFLKLLAVAGVAIGNGKPGSLLGQGGSSSEDSKQVNKGKHRHKNVMDLKARRIRKVRVGIIGLGMRGHSLSQLFSFLPSEKAEVVAVCDLEKNRVERVRRVFTNKNKPGPKMFYGSKEAWKKLCDLKRLDLVVIATPWKSHVPMGVYVMEQNKHVCIEVPMAYTVEDCWTLVNTAEKTRKHCMMLENCCYNKTELTLLKMAKAGVFGELTHAEAAYIHDLRELLTHQRGYHDMWRIKHHLNRDGNLYPTHGLGPVAQYLDIERGDRFEYIVSVSSKEASLRSHTEKLSTSHPFYNRKFKCGDINTSIIKTARGRTIMLQHDVVTPRPYSRLNTLCGTKGIFKGYPNGIALGHQWLNRSKYSELMNKHYPEIWKNLGKDAQKGAFHGGMDYVMVYRLIDCLNKGKPLDIDVYDGASWSVVSHLSELSVEQGGKPVNFPDFTQGKWEKQRNLNIMSVI